LESQLEQNKSIERLLPFVTFTRKNLKQQRFAFSILLKQRLVNKCTTPTRNHQNQLCSMEDVHGANNAALKVAQIKLKE
jgi:hypothetical protein